MFQAKAIFAGSQPNTIRVNEADEIEWNGKMYKKNKLSFQAPVSGAIYGTLFNFKEQYDAMEDLFHKEPYKKPPERPVLYIKPKNTINSHRGSIPVPIGETAVQINPTLGVVIGRNATRVKEADAFHYIEGYTIVNDVSIPHESYYRPNIKNKVRDGFCSIGPWIVDQAEILRPDELTIQTFRNGDLVQVNQMKDLVRPIPKLLEAVTEFMTLARGDMLLVGIPNNASIAHPGDKVRITIDQIGSLENTVMEESEILSGGAM